MTLLRNIEQGSSKPRLLQILDVITGKAVAVDNNNPVPVSVPPESTLPVSFGDTPSIDAFGRLRVSNPIVLFDSKNIFNDPDQTDASEENLPLFFDNQGTSGAGTGTQYLEDRSSQELSVGASTAGIRVRQTKMRFNYQPGKSQLIDMTFNMNGGIANILKKEGIFDENNGIYFELDGVVPQMVLRSSATGAVVNNEVVQSSWNKDTLDGSGNSSNPSGITANFSTTQILVIDFEWLGVGRVRIGFNIDGVTHYVHEFKNANNLDKVYMRTPNLPLRSEIENNGSGVAATLEQICSTVISEGGSTDLGALRYASTNGAHVDMATENVIYAVVGIRLKTAYIGETIRMVNTSLQLQTGTDRIEWIWILNPDVAGTFAYADELNSAVQIARGAAANVVTNGYSMTGGYLESGGSQSGNAGSGDRGIDNAILLGSLIDGTRDEMVLCARPIGGSSAVDVEGAISWREIP